MPCSLVSILLFVALAHARRHAARSAFESKGGQDLSVRIDREEADSHLSAVIAQMFEWNWNSVAAECTNFLGPAGYGFVQGEHLRLIACRVLTIPILSEPCTGARPWPPMVDGLPARLVHPHVQARHAGAVREHDPHLPRSRCRGHRWFVENIKS